MTITVDNKIRIDDPSPTMCKWCEDNLVFANPDYAKKVRMNLWVNGTPKTIVLYEKSGTSLILPYGCLNSVFEIMKGGDQINIKIPRSKKVDFEAEIPLYDYQTKAVKIMLDSACGILKAPAGSGKTQMGLALAAKLGRKTLWLTHTKDLLDQSKERALQYMSPDLIGTITGGKVDIGEVITFATVQTMCNVDLAQYKNEWDTIIVDECHRVAGTPTAVTRFSKVLNALAARHKYGLSATVHRSDGMVLATFALLGKVVATVSDDEVASKIMKVTIYPRATNTQASWECFNSDGTIHYAKLINYLAAHTERNEQITKDLIDNSDHYNLILSDRIAHLETLIHSLPEELSSQAVLITGQMAGRAGKTFRKKALDDMKAGRKRYLFATYALAKEGLDIPRLDRLFMVSPQKDYAIVAQSVGRVARSFKGKQEAVVYDYVDERIPFLVKTYKKRCTTYRKINCTILKG